jgi:hypothetical protein
LLEYIFKYYGDRVMSWEYRVVKKVNKIPVFLKKNNPDVGDFDILYEIHDVYYDKNLDKPSIGRISLPLSDTVEGLQWHLEKMIEACKKPVIDYNTGEQVN